LISLQRPLKDSPSLNSVTFKPPLAAGGLTFKIVNLLIH
jgi:hypothetical protein